MIQFTIARYRLRRAFPVAFMLRILLALVPGLILTAFWRPTSWVGLILAGLAFALLFLVCCCCCARSTPKTINSSRTPIVSSSVSLVRS